MVASSTCLNTVASQPGAQMVRAPGHRLGEDARFFLRHPRGTLFRLPYAEQLAAETMYQNQLLAAREELGPQMMTAKQTVLTWVRMFVFWLRGLLR